MAQHKAQQVNLEPHPVSHTPSQLLHKHHPPHLFAIYLFYRVKPNNPTTTHPLYAVPHDRTVQAFSCFCPHLIPLPQRLRTSLHRACNDQEGFLLSRQSGEVGDCSSQPCSAPPHLHGLAISPHHAFPIALPDEVHLLPCPLRGDAQLHLEPAGLPPGREHAAASPRCGERPRGEPLVLRRSTAGTRRAAGVSG